MSMKNGKCDRCGQPTTVFRMSRYNTEECCTDCLKAEEQRKDYKQAQEAELNEVRKGNYNFKGVGL